MSNSYNKYLNELQIQVLKWAELRYTKSQINKAGAFFKKENNMSVAAAVDILDNFRAVHSYPMQVFYVRLQRLSKSLESNSLVAQRLKRATSIVAKLNRKYGGKDPTMELYQMQDIGGCRAIFSNVDLVRKLADEKYIKGDLKHKLVGQKDYIKEPKLDGYRGIHLIYRYKSDKPNKTKYNNLLVEVQIRSKLQHVWATAVETVDFFSKQAIKSNEGLPAWMEFFRLVSSAFAKMEKCPPVPNTPDDKKELYTQILQKEKELNVIDKMTGWTMAMKTFDEEMKKKEAKFFLLELDIDAEKLTVRGYTKKEEQVALNEYASLEKKYSGNKAYDVVLVGIDAARDLKRAYPNYYVDMSEFVKHLEAIKKDNEQ